MAFSLKRVTKALNNATLSVHQASEVVVAFMRCSRGAITAIIEALHTTDALSLQRVIGRQLTSRHKKKSLSLHEQNSWHNRSSM